MSTTTFSCPYCPDDYSAPSETLLLAHIRITHSNEPNFSIQCSTNGCARTFTNFRTYQNHRLTHRRQVQRRTRDDEVEDNGNYAVDAHPLEVLPTVSPTTTDMQSFTAKWILKTRETRSLTRTAMQGVIQDVSDLVSFVTQTLESQTHVALCSHGIEPKSIPGLDEVFSGPATKPFEGLTSFHQQVQYCRHNFTLVVSWRIIFSYVWLHCKKPECIIIHAVVYIYWMWETAWPLHVRIL